MTDNKPVSFYFTTPSGVRLQLRRVPAELIYDLQSPRGRPVPPTKSIQVAGGGRIQVEDEENEDYQLARNKWIMSQAMKLTKVLAVMGVADEPPADQVEQYEFFGYILPAEIKYAWIQKLIEGVEEDFMERVMSLSMANEEGLEEAERIFRSTVQSESGSSTEADQLETTEEQAVEELPQDRN